ncbi:MAG: ferritin family protein [Pseudomonadota bacterium]
MNKALAEVLNEALLDEYKSRDTYQKIIDTFGPVRPFINIVEAEQRHIDLLLPLYEKHAIPLPPKPDPERITTPDNLLEACEIGAAAEIENVAMYNRLIQAADLPDVADVLRRLQTASRDHHLPAFQRCVERGGGRGSEGGRGKAFGKGRGRGHGARFGRS